MKYEIANGTTLLALAILDDFEGDTNGVFCFHEMFAHILEY